MWMIFIVLSTYSEIIIDSQPYPIVMFAQKLKKNDTNHVMYVFLPVFLPKQVMKKDEKNIQNPPCSTTPAPLKD